jgi:hypothetical protein
MFETKAVESAGTRRLAFQPDFRRINLMRLTVSVLLCVLLVFGAAYAQTDRGKITGTVTDPAGAVIPNAALEAKNLQTGTVFNAATSTTGNYTLDQLPIGMYQVAASLDSHGREAI